MPDSPVTSPDEHPERLAHSEDGGKSQTPGVERRHQSDPIHDEVRRLIDEAREALERPKPIRPRR